MKLQDKTGLIASVLLAATTLLAGCGGLGNGVLPVNAVIQPLGGLEGAASTKAFTCLNTGLSLFLDFSDGSRGDFTSRATYSSSNPAVARISNLDIAVPESTGRFFARGTIVPVSPGTATLTATYLSFTRSIEVTVTELQNLSISPPSGDLAANSRLDLSVSADLNGVITPIDSAVQWAFVSPNDALATIDVDTGTITGVAAGNGLTARARIPGCALFTEAPVSVGNLQSLALTREFGDQDTLIVGTSERLIATGTLDNGLTQDLSTQVSYTSSDTSAITLFNGGLVNLTVAIKALTSPVQFTANFANPAVTSPAIGITPVSDTLNSIAVSPTTAEVSAGLSQQFTAVGSYASGATQDITRHVGWSSSNTGIAVVQSSGSTVNGLAGLASTSSAGGGNSVTITATAATATAQTTATATLAIK